MDINESNQIKNSPDASAPDDHKSGNRQTKSKQSMYFILVLFLLIIVGLGGFWLGKNSNNYNTSVSTQAKRTLTQVQPTQSISKASTAPYSPHPEPSYAKDFPTLEPDRILPTGTITYTNPAGFSLVYAAGEYTVACANNKFTYNDFVQQRKVFEDGDTIYLAFPATAIETEIIKTTPSLNYPKTKCRMQTTDLNLIKNGWSEVRDSKPPFNSRYPDTIMYSYRKVSTDSDLISLAQQKFGSGCVKVNKTPVNGHPDIFSIKTSDAEGKDDAGSKCWSTGSAYDFYYSVKNKVAVLGNGVQNCPYPEISVANGVGHGCRTQIVFN